MPLLLAKAETVTLGKFLRQQRGRTGLKQREIAAHAGIDASKLSRLERDQWTEFPSPEEIQRLADALGCEPEALILAAGYISQREPAAVRTMTEDNARLDQLPPKQRRILERIINDFFAEEEEP